MIDLKPMVCLHHDQGSLGEAVYTFVICPMYARNVYQIQKVLRLQPALFSFFFWLRQSWLRPANTVWEADDAILVDKIVHRFGVTMRDETVGQTLAASANSLYTHQTMFLQLYYRA